MTTFTCGCTEDGYARCSIHTPWDCHEPDGPPRVFIHGPGPSECPPCYLARLRSVSLDGRATPTRRKG